MVPCRSTARSQTCELILAERTPPHPRQHHPIGPISVLPIINFRVSSFPSNAGYNRHISNQAPQRRSHGHLDPHLLADFARRSVANRSNSYAQVRRQAFDWNLVRHCIAAGTPRQTTSHHPSCPSLHYPYSSCNRLQIGKATCIALPCQSHLAVRPVRVSRDSSTQPRIPAVPGIRAAAANALVHAVRARRRDPWVSTAKQLPATRRGRRQRRQRRRPRRCRSDCRVPSGCRRSSRCGVRGRRSWAAVSATSRTASAGRLRPHHNVGVCHASHAPTWPTATTPAASTARGGSSGGGYSWRRLARGA